MAIKSAAALALILAGVPAGVSAQAVDADARVLFEARLRSETVEQAGFLEQAHALTLRARLGWRSPTAHGLQLLVEGEGVAVLDDRYSAPVDPVPGRPAVADGETLELNRAQLRWTRSAKTQVRVTGLSAVVDSLTASKVCSFWRQPTLPTKRALSSTIRWRPTVTPVPFFM